MMKVIIVEDESLTSKWIKKKVEELDMGFSVEGVFSNGSQALKYLETQEADVIFTDIQMPVMDGLELLEEIQKMNIQPYKVILSAYDEFCYARRAMKLGAQEFLLKPEITEESLCHVLKEARSFREQIRLSGQDTAKSLETDRERILRRLTGPEGEQGEEELFSLPAGQGTLLASQDLVMAVAVFDGTARKKPVLELLNLFLEQEQAEGGAFANSDQEFVIFYSGGHDSGRKQMEKLRTVLRTHMGTEVYLGVSRPKKDSGLREMYRQASMACENRRFFMIPGCQYFENMRITTDGNAQEFCFYQDMRQAEAYLRQKQYRQARDRVEEILEEIQKSSYLYPSYVKTVCSQFLGSYLHELWQYDLTEEEKEQTGTLRLLFGQTASNILVLKEEAARAVDYMTKLLEAKAGISAYSPPIQELLRYVEEHYGERISLAQVSEAIYLSQSYVSTLFKKETGKKFSSYLQEVRLEKSREMLSETRLSVQEISARAGFFDISHFSRAFKDRYGLPPLEYRKTKKITKN